MQDTPHTFTRQFIYHDNWELLEYVCNEFNIDADRLVGLGMPAATSVFVGGGTPSMVPRCNA